MTGAEQVNQLVRQADGMLASLRAIDGSSSSVGAESENDHVARSLAALARSLTEAATVAEGLRTQAEAAHAAWRQRNRFTPLGRQTTLDDLETLRLKGLDRAQSVLLAEVAAAARALEIEHAVVVLRACSTWSAVPAEVLEDLGAWSRGSDLAGIRAVQALARVGAGPRARRNEAASTDLAMTEAWLRRDVGDESASLGILDQLVAKSPSDALLRAERSGLLLGMGRTTQAADEAHRAIEIGPLEPRAHLQAGVVSEVTGLFAEAAELYGEASRLAVDPTLEDVAGATFLRRTGLFLLSAAELLCDNGALDASLVLVEQAIELDIAGSARYPDAPARELRWRLMRDLGRPAPEVAAAALDAGKHLVWNGEAVRAEAPLRAATTLPDQLPESGWLLAHCMQTRAWESLEGMQEAVAFWEEWQRTVGPPAAASSWAYSLRASMGEQVAVLKHEGFADALWQGILLSEKGLVLDPTDIGSWTVLTRFYHSLSLSQLAKEASDSAFKINPDDQAMLAERIAALVDAGSAQEAFDTIERMSGQQSDPWLSTVKAELLKREGRSAEALACMGVAPSTAWDLEWFLFVRAECQVDLGHLDAAISDLEAMLGLDVSLTGDEASRRAYALAVLGRQDEAAQLLARTMTRETPDPNARALAESAIALSNGEVERAFRELTSSLRTSQDRITAEETLAALGRAVVLLEFAGRSLPAADGLMDEARRSLREMAPRVADADSELEFALAQFAAAPDDSPEVVALVATKARRLLERSLPDEAAQLYRKLMGTPFEPHAGQAAAHALERAFQEAVQRGQLDETRDLFDRLAQLGHPPTSDVDLALAQALRQRGDYSEEVAILLPMVQSVKEPEERLSVLELLGEGALLSGQADVAVPVLDEAYELAAGTADSSRAAHIAVRQAVAKATVGDLGSSTRYLVLALGQLAKAGVWDPQVILRLEMEWLTSTLPAETRQSLTNLLESALRLATARSPQAQDDPSEP